MMLNLVILIIYSTTAIIASPAVQPKSGFRSILPVKVGAKSQSNPKANGNGNTKSAVSKPAIKNSPILNKIKDILKSPGTKSVVKSVPQPLAQVQKLPVTNKLSNVKGSAVRKNATISTDTKSRKPENNNPENKPFRVMGKAVTGFQHKNGTFSHEAYSKGMNALSKSQKFRESSVPHPRNKPSRRQSTSSDNSSIFVINTDITYDTALVTELKVGSPSQTIPFVVNLEMPDSVLWKKSDTCISGYDLDASNTVTQLSKDIYSGDIPLEGLLESIEEVSIDGTLIRDGVTFPSYPSEEHLLVVASTFIWASFTAISQRCLAQVGLGAFFYEDSTLWPLPAFAIGWGAYITWSLYVTAVHPTELPAQYAAEIMIGASEKSKYTGRMYKIGVSKTTGRYTNYPWKLEFGLMIVNNVALTIPAATVTFSLVHVGIHLQENLVKAIYKAIGKFKTYPITPGGPLVYTYLCKLNPRVAFSIPKTHIRFDVDPQDFNLGLHPTEPGYCIGAVQLPNDPEQGPVHTLGLVFYKSWYTVFEKNPDGSSKSIRIAKAAKQQP